MYEVILYRKSINVLMNCSTYMYGIIVATTIS
jgi:hypothetical protein